MTQFDMKYVESVGLIKMDFLGLRTLTVLQEACVLIQRYHNVDLDIWTIPFDDEIFFQKMKFTPLKNKVALLSLYKCNILIRVNSL